MKGLDGQQREVFADYFRKVALMAAASLFFGQFVPVAGKTINWQVATWGGFLSLVAIIIAALFTRMHKD